MKFASLAMLAVSLSGCSLFSHGETGKSAVPESQRTLHELCDFPKQFYITRFNATELKVSPAQGKSLTEKIGNFNECSYRNGDSKYLGYVYISYRIAGETPTVSKYPPSRILTVDGVPVTQVIEPLPPTWEPSAPPPIQLSAADDGVDGQLRFYSSDDETIQAGAKVLVNMIRTLKN
ncbi:hypothetical protein [Nocardia sp. NPDC052566]|uniref:hypothetical protein n=1 Tax=Nocardia sp. NPDC052566 TaxID=3364330 RepID=UPI0037C8BECF